MMRDEYIKGYRITKPLTNDSSGNGKWGYAEKDGIELFIKEFLTPKYPLDPSLFKEEAYNKNLEKCRIFQDRKIRLYNELLRCVSGNIIPVIDFFRFNTKYYMVTEKVDNISLTIEELFQLNDVQKLILMKLITNSVNEIHYFHIVHADLKPDNILIKRTKLGGFTAKLIDFDSSFLEKEIPPVDEIQGDLVYLAPETYRYMSGEKKTKISTKIDVFAIGVFFYQLLCGKLPKFEGEEYEYPFEAVLDKKKLVINPGLPINYVKILSRMLEENPKKRATMNEVSKLLNQIVY